MHIKDIKLTDESKVNSAQLVFNPWRYDNRSYILTDEDGNPRRLLFPVNRQRARVNVKTVIARVSFFSLGDEIKCDVSRFEVKDIETQTWSKWIQAGRVHQIDSITTALQTAVLLEVGAFDKEV